MSVEYKLFYQFKTTNTWKAQFFEAKSDLAAISYAGQWVQDTAAKKYYEPISKWGLEKITTERLI